VKADDLLTFALVLGTGLLAICMILLPDKGARWIAFAGFLIGCFLIKVEMNRDN
jgi:hypothetical protein